MRQYLAGVAISAMVFAGGCSGSDPAVAQEASKAGPNCQFGDIYTTEAKLQSVTSPDGKLSLNISDLGGALNYSVTMNGVAVIGESGLGMRFANLPAFDRQVKIKSIKTSSFDETWEQPWGERRFVREHYNELFLETENLNGCMDVNIRVRVFDDGLGFRYEIPDQAGLGDIAIMDELTEFNVGRGGEAWWIPSRMYNRYEYLYQNTDIDSIQQVHTPVTIKQENGTHVSIHEAALINYSGMSLRQAREGILEAELAPRSDGAKVKLNGGFVTPWRTIQISEDAKGLVNSDLIINLNEPNKLGDMSWFEPGKYAGIWWDMHVRNRSWGKQLGDINNAHGATTEYTKKYLDFAAENDFVGVLVEGWNIGWDNDWYNNGDVFSFTETYDDFDIEEVAAYAQKVGTRLIGHHETSGNISNYENQLEDALDLYEKSGVRVIKTGYVADDGEIKRVGEDGIARYEFHDSQHQVDHHMKVVTRAAEHKIAINPHEPVKDTGLRRTYPNWITREGARGQEFNAWGVPPNGPDHIPNMVYTRMLSGPMDYTAGAFNLRPSEAPEALPSMGRNDVRSRIEHTLAKELALYVVIYSPVQMVIDSPEEYVKRPDAFQFIKDVPTDWEESIALDGEVGDYAVIARKDRNSADWYVGGVSDENPLSYALDLSFLGEGKYEAQIYRDGPDANYDTNPYPITIETKSVSSDQTLDLDMAPGGGFAIRFKKL